MCMDVDSKTNIKYKIFRMGFGVPLKAKEKQL